MAKRKAKPVATNLKIDLCDDETKRWVELPYFSQLDNGYESGYTCNSAMCWMLACFAKPELAQLHGLNGDYNYYYTSLVAPYGDTTDHTNQTAALDYLGISSEWRTDVSLEQVAEHIEQFEQPVGLGVLHSGSDPYSGGHMIVAHGTYRNVDGELTALVVSDSNGEMDLVGGGYRGMPEDGMALRYSYTNLVRRFECDGEGYYSPGPCGWARFLA